MEIEDESDKQIRAEKLSRLLVHSFSGDPWGPCTLCKHPAYHEIHFEDEEEKND